MAENDAAKIVKTFAWASFLSDLGSDMIFPIWPLFVTQVLGANMAILGLVDGLGEAMVSLSQAAAGYLADKFHRRKVFVWSGYLCGAIARLGYGLAGVWWHLIPFKIFDRAGKIRGAPRDAIVADVSIQENRGRNFGLIRAMDNLGAVGGVLLCLLLFKTLGYRTLFLLAALPTSLAALLIFLRVKEEKPERKIFKGLSLKNLDRDFYLFLFISAIFSLSAFSYSFLLIFARDCGCQPAFLPVLYLFFTAAASLSSYPFGHLADKIGRKTVLALSYCLWALVCLLFIYFQSELLIILAFICYGLHKGALEPVQKAFVAELAPPAFRASSLGGYQMVVGICALPASLLAGLLWDKINPVVPFYFSLGLTILALVLLPLVRENRNAV